MIFEAKALKAYSSQDFYFFCSLLFPASRFSQASLIYLSPKRLWDWKLQMELYIFTFNLKWCNSLSSEPSFVFSCSSASSATSGFMSVISSPVTPAAWGIFESVQKNCLECNVLTSCFGAYYSEKRYDVHLPLGYWWRDIIASYPAAFYPLRFLSVWYLNDASFQSLNVGSFRKMLGTKQALL